MSECGQCRMFQAQRDRAETAEWELRTAIRNIAAIASQALDDDNVDVTDTVAVQRIHSIATVHAK